MMTLLVREALPAPDRIDVACAHCGLPVPAGLVEPTEARQFCCGGCRAVWSTIHACGLERYYELAEREAALGRELDAAGADARRPATVTGQRYGHFDRPEFTARHVRRDAAGRATCEFRLDGLRCGACVWLLEALPRIVSGLLSVRVDLGRSAVAVTYDDGRIGLGEIARRFDTLGYQLLPLADPASRELDRAADRRWLVRLGVAGAIASNAMALAFALYGGHFATMADSYRLFFQWLSVGLAALALAWPGRIFFINALTALRTRTPHMDLPVATGLAVMVIGGLVNTIRGSGSIYCESATMLVFLLLVGRFVQFRQQRAARQRIELITALVPAVARRIGEEGVIEEVPIEALIAGDRVQVPAGESVPCDGSLRDGVARFDVSILTGESKPAAIETGGEVWAGTRPLDRPVEVTVSAVGAATRAGRLAAMVSEASSRRPPIVELVDRIGGWFLATVLALATVTILVWWPRIGPDAALERAVALLVVTCPCALGLATPLAIVAGIGKAARRGILVKGGDILERISRARTVVLDKTGTITEGRVAVVEQRGDGSALAMAALLERSSAHPIAAAFVAALPAPEGASVSEIEEIAGGGVRGLVEGRRVVVGSERFQRRLGSVVPEWAESEARTIAARGRTPIFVSVDGAVVAIAGVGDPVRPDAAAAIDRLRRSGLRVLVASGDHPTVVAAVAAEVGIGPDDCLGGLEPEEKVAFVRDRPHPTPVVMVGDGVNDLGAMAAADVGVAVRNGAQAALSVSDVCLAAGGLAPLVRLVEGSRRTLATIRLNLAVSVSYNALGAVLAFTGLINPLVAAILMPISGLTVTAIALSKPRFDLATSVPGRGGKD
jgi:Cu2+-exporting ATPase